MADNATRASRILTMIPLVRSRPGIKLEELAQILGCNGKTVMADLDAILMCGVPPYMPSDYVGVYIEDGGVRIDFADHFRRPVTLTLQEALSLQLALNAMPLLPGEAVNELRKKVEALVPETVRGKVKKGFRIVAGGAALRAKLAALNTAIAENREIEITYYTAGRDVLTERRIQPYGLVELRGEWYVIGNCLLRDRELPFRVDRIKQLRQLESRFKIPAEFSIEKYRRPEMYFSSERDTIVRIRVDAELARRVREEMAYPETETLANGDTCFRIRVSHPEWVLAWAIQYGDQVEILEPQSLRESMRKLCDSLLCVYE
jgi:predicted DNA-binding transcriptional regulator YafY